MMRNDFFNEKEEDISNKEIIDEDYDAENFEGEKFDDDDCKDDNYKLIYDKTYLEQLKYLYPDDELLKKAKKVYLNHKKHEDNSNCHILNCIFIKLIIFFIGY